MADWGFSELDRGFSICQKLVLNFGGEKKSKIKKILESESKLNTDMGRKKKSNPKRSNDDSFDENLAIEIYRSRKSFEKPENIGLETVFESRHHEDAEESSATIGRAARASKAKLQPKLRQITTQPYWVEDSEKTALRKKQISKLFKGRKKMKWKGLSAKQEEKLIQTIQEKSDTEEETEESFVAIENKARMPFLITDSDQSAEEPIVTDHSAEQEKMELVTDENIKDADAFLGPLGFSDDENDDDEASTFRPLKFDTCNKENPPRCKDRRKSKIATVRRSSRLFRGPVSGPLKDQSNNLGSMYQNVEIADRSRSRRAALSLSPLAAAPLSLSPLPPEDTFALYKDAPIKI